MNEYIDFIQANLSERALLEQLAEEAAELAQAALKMIRASSNENPTPVTKDQAYIGIIEECADISNCLNALGYNTLNERLLINYTMQEKQQRWVERIKETQSSEGVSTKREVHMAFTYGCTNCLNRETLWIEKGLEESCNPKLREKSGLPHKPTPFMIKCPKCGAFMYHIATSTQLEKFEPAQIGTNLFINSEEHDCGKPVFNWQGE